MQRRRFLAIGASAALILAGCGRWLRDAADEVAQTESPASGSPSSEAAPTTREAAPPEAEPPEEPPVEEGEATAPTEDPSDGEEAEHTADEGEPASELDREVDPELLEAEPTEWGEAVTGVGSRLADTSVIALTLDACGGPNGSGYDAALIEHLRDHEVPATLFMNARWVETNPSVFDELADDPLFEIANHGTEHRPLSVDGRSVYGISGTASAEAVIDEVVDCQELLLRRTGRSPRFFRSGTAYYDDVAVRIVQALGLEVAGYSVLGDAGATFSASQVRDALLGAAPGSIVLLHMNHPGSGTADGVAAALTTLRDRGVTFTTLGDHTLR